MTSESAESVNLLRISEYFDEIPKTFSEVLNRLRLMSGIHRVLDAEHWTILDTKDRLTSEIASGEKRIEVLLHRLTKPLWFYREAAILDELAETISALRQAHDNYLDQDAKFATLQVAMNNVQQEESYIEKRVTEVHDLLASHVPSGARRTSIPFVNCKSLNESFSDLLAAVSMSPTEQIEAICKSVVSVTLEGLARIVGSEYARVAAIAEKIVFSSAVLKCPPHGGIARADSLLKAYALPPVNAPFRELLRAEIKRLDGKAKVVFNDGADFAHVGLTVIRYFFRGFKSINELLVGTIKQDYLKTQQSPTWRMRFPTGQDPWPYLAQLAKRRTPSLPRSGFDPSNN